MENKSKYYVVKNKNLAITISYLLNTPFYTYDDLYEKGKKIYSFEDTVKFREILTLVMNTRNNK